MGSSPPVVTVPVALQSVEWRRLLLAVPALRCIYVLKTQVSCYPGPEMKPRSPAALRVPLAGLRSLDLGGLAILPLSNAPFFSVGPVGDEV